MSKKVFIKVIAVLVVAILATMCFASCKLFSENEERVYNEALYTVTGADDIQLDVTRSEVLSMYSTYASYYVQYGGYTYKEVMDMVVESKIKSKYLVTIGMSRLTDASKTSQARIDALCGVGGKNDPSRALTKAEYYAAIKSVNDSIQETLDSYIEEAKQDEYKSAVKALDSTDVYGIEFTADTIQYFADSKNSFYVNQSIDNTKVEFVVVYNKKDETTGERIKSKPCIVPDSMYTTEFSSEKAATDSELVISFNETIIDEDGEETTEAHTATIVYDVVEARATRTVEEETNVDEIELENGVKVNRYATDVPVVEKLDPNALYEDAKKSGDSVRIDACRQLVNNLESNYTSMDRLYAAQFESAVLSALQVEIKKGANEVTAKDVLAQFDYLYNKSKADYDTATTQEEKQEKFGENIKDGLSDVYYYPAIDNIQGYYYVYQILFKFSDEQADWLKSQIVDGDEDRAEELYEYMLQYITTKESNPDYDADYDCPKHEKGTGDCIYKGEGVCPSCAYLPQKESNPNYDADYDCPKHEQGTGACIYEGEGVCPSCAYLPQYVTDVMEDLKADLEAATTPEAKLEVFLDYVYRYNDDGGIMNSEAGYVIAPEGNVDPNSFYAAFTGLARDVYDHSPVVGNAFVADGELGYAFTPYGVHIIMISATPFAECKDNTALVFDGSADREKEVLAYLNRVITVDGDTLYNTIAKGLKSDNESKKYSDFTTANIPSDLCDVENEEYSKAVKVHKSAVKDFYEEYIGDTEE